MKVFNFKKTTNEGVMISRLWLAVVALMLLVSVTSCIIGYLIGKTEKTDRFSGQIIDTITISSGQAEKDDDISQIYKINIRGKVLYTDGRPFQYSSVELKSKVKYTTTDKYGRFEFINVEDGSHTISILENGTVLASSTFTIEKTGTHSSAQIAQLADGDYLILSPIDLSVIQIVLELDKDKTILGLRIEPETNKDLSVDSMDNKTPEGSDDSEASAQSQEPDTPVEPDVPTDPKKPSGNDAPGGEPDDTPPNITVSDDINSSQVWTQSTSVDIFAERAGNTGVQTILGGNVIAPGSSGKYIFKIKNTEMFPVLFSVSFSETDHNDPALPLRYRLKAGMSDDGYIGGMEWKNAENILISGASLAPGETAFYTVEWKWDADDDLTDTIIGMQEEKSIYVLDIIISARSE